MEVFKIKKLNLGFVFLGFFEGGSYRTEKTNFFDF